MLPKNMVRIKGHKNDLARKSRNSNNKSGNNIAGHPVINQFRLENFQNDQFVWFSHNRVNGGCLTHNSTVD